MVQFCAEHHIAHEQCGKVVVATDSSELSRLDALWERGQANGLKGLERLSPERLHEIEPHAAGLAAIRVPEEGIVDYAGVTAKLGERIRDAGGKIHLGVRCQRLSASNHGWRVSTAAGELHSRFVVTCAGLHSDRLVKASGQRAGARIIPFRGEYYTIKPERQFLVRNLIYPVPDPKFPFLGVHFTRLVHGGIEAGPNAVLAFAREGYRWTDVNVRDLVGSALFPGLWRFLFRFPSLCGYEIWRSLSKAEFCRSLQKLVPAIRVSDLAPGGSGVRAQAMSADGRLVEDFHFEEQPGILHVINAPSPAATAALAIGETLAERVLARAG
jgi:L-2-hydroxyglutarate oxidase